MSSLSPLRIPRDIFGSDIVRSVSGPPTLSTPNGQYPHFITNSQQLVVSVMTTMKLPVNFILGYNDNGQSMMRVETPHLTGNNPTDEIYEYFTFEPFHQSYVEVTPNLMIAVPGNYGYRLRSLVGGTIIITNDMVYSYWGNITEQWQIGSVIIMDPAGYRTTISVT